MRTKTDTRHLPPGVPGCGVMVEHKVVHARGANVEVRVVVHRLLHMPLVQLAVHLRPRALRNPSSVSPHSHTCTLHTHPYSGPARHVQHVELDARLVCMSSSVR